MKDEYGIIFDTDHFAVHDGPGIRTVIYFKGCPLRCAWCHNPESHRKEPQILYIAERCKNCPLCLGDKCVNGAKVICGKYVKASEIVNEVIDDKIFFDSSGGGVTLSGGEILFQPEFAKSLLAMFHDRGIHTLVETSGMGKWDNLRDIAGYTDIFYYDIKSMDNEKHIKYTGAENKIILDNLKKLAENMPDKIVLRVPLIPGYNDSTNEITEIYRLAQELRISQIHLLRYNTSAPAKYQWLDLPYQPGELKKQSEDYIEILRKIAPKEINIIVF
ncbi:MAG: glycyl-radical enzyme activating protein [Oscillospiraceae bacterium]|nr:glycyl-radical enzyme activating protein [Oscillospiraceae bacterium]